MGYHRKSNYWEPTYDGKTELSDLADFRWDLLFSSNGPFKSKCYWGTYPRDYKSIRDKIFKICDFQGDLESITFTKCCFKSCYWHRYIWKKIKFQQCTFDACSFSFATFDNCLFIDCVFTRIGISGNETNFINCVIDPIKLLKSCYTNLDANVLKSRNKTHFEQSARLEQTKSELAKKIRFLNNQYSKYYYLSVKVDVLQEITARISARKLNNKNKNYFIKLLQLPPLFTDYAEYFFMKISGMINCWGCSICRCFMVGAGIILSFALYYYFN